MPGKTTLVSSAAQLLKAAKSAVGGGTILLAPGNYGDVSIANLRPTITVTIKSANRTPMPASRPCGLPAYPT